VALSHTQQAFSKYTAMTKKLTLKQAASHKSGKERHCSRCEFVPMPVKACPYLHICDAAFRRGFIKGYEYRRDLEKSKSK